jgi:tetratricopeptide (TPR) repeat protein
LRNSYFYLGDCAFDLGQWDVAIRQYDAARERYGNQPAALVAMVQIVSAHLKQGDLRRAAVANERAKNFYKRLPASVWDDPNLPMGQAEWKRWLDASDQLDRAARGEGAEAVPTANAESKPPTE